MKTNMQTTKPQTQLTTLPAGASPVNGDAGPLVDRSPAVAGFLTARVALQQRQRDLENELAEIKKMLNGDCHLLVPAKAAAPPTSSPPRRRSNTGLTKAVVALLTHGPLTKDQIVEKLKAQNFPFFGQPKPALDPVLYSKKFLRQGKLFGLAVAP